MTCGNCVECGRGVIQQRTWLAASSDLQAQWKEAGHRMLRGRGLCHNCYHRAYRKKLFSAETAPVTVVRCRRCSLPSTTPLCVDCTDVATDLNEVSRWVA